MKTLLDFTRRVFSMPTHWRIWIVILFATNMAAVLFLPRVEATVVLAALMVGAAAQMVLFAHFGFVRLLGIGHAHWIPLVFWLGARLETVAGETLYYNWVVAVMVVCSLSLVIDVVDVVRYLMGERQPTIAPLSVI